MYAGWHVHGTGAVLRKKKRLADTVTLLYLDVVNIWIQNTVVLYVQSFHLERNGF